jgi:GNAT superfamily N-acetyltransferase
LQISVAREEDLEELVRLRIDFVLDTHPEATPSQREEAEAATRAYITEGMCRGNYVGYIGRLDGRLACAAALLIYKLPPMTNRIDRTQGHVLNVFTYPEFRRRGYANEMMGFLAEDARRRGIFRLYLNATRMGEPLYRAIGFHEQEEKALVLEL